MKLKQAAAAVVLAAMVIALAGCVDKKDNPGTTTENASISASDSENDNNGEYEAGKDGKVNEDDNDGGDGDTAGKDGAGNNTTTQMPETNEGTPRVSEGDEDARPSDITDDGIVTGTGDPKITDSEAAFASSYIDSMALRTEKIGWGLGKERDSENRPTDAVNAEKKYASLGGRFLAKDGTICLTFDEGYENGYTAKILDTLKEKDVKAVFFVTYDYCRTAPELVQRMIDEGHTVGNHTWSHPSMPDITQKEVWAEVTKLHDYVKSEFGYEMTLFRFPKGEFSEQTLDDVHNLGYTSLFWSFAYADWDPNKQTDAADALARIEQSTHSGIYLLHAVSPTNADILGTLIDYWREKGYSVGAEF